MTQNYKHQQTEELEKRSHMAFAQNGLMLSTNLCELTGSISHIASSLMLSSSPGIKALHILEIKNDRMSGLKGMDKITNI